MNFEGYWYSKQQPEYPVPQPNVLTNTEAVNIFTLIRRKEQKARKISFKGESNSRITGQKLGNSEYRLNGWVWPGDFAKHYVLTHKVRPTNKFLEFIGGNKV